MQIHQFATEFDDLSSSRQRQGLTRLFEEIARDPEQYHEIIQDILELASSLEADDYFGTEGLDV